MAHAKRHSGHGAWIKVKKGASYVKIGGLHGDPVLFSGEAELIDVLGHDSPSDKPGGAPRREYIGGPIDSSSRTLLFYRDLEDEGQNELRSSVGETLSFQTGHPGWDKDEEFDAVVESAEETSVLEGALTFEVTLKPTGPQTEVVGGTG